MAILPYKPGIKAAKAAGKRLAKKKAGTKKPGGFYGSALEKDQRGSLRKQKKILARGLAKGLKKGSREGTRPYRNKYPYLQGGSEHPSTRK